MSTSSSSAGFVCGAAAIVAIVVASRLIGQSASPVAQDAFVPALHDGRWKVVAIPGSPQNDRAAILLDSATGDTWFWNQGATWTRISR